MKTLVLAATLLLFSHSLLPSPALAQTKQKPKTTPPKPTQVKPAVGVKGASQMAGGAIRFGELFALKNGTLVVN